MFASLASLSCILEWSKWLRHLGHSKNTLIDWLIDQSNNSVKLMFAPKKKGERSTTTAMAFGGLAFDKHYASNNIEALAMMGITLLVACFYANKFLSLECSTRTPRSAAVATAARTRVLRSKDGRNTATAFSMQCCNLSTVITLSQVHDFSYLKTLIVWVCR